MKPQLIVLALPTIIFLDPQHEECTRDEHVRVAASAPAVESRITHDFRFVNVDSEADCEKEQVDAVTSAFDLNLSELTGTHDKQEARTLL